MNKSIITLIAGTALVAPALFASHLAFADAVEGISDKQACVRDSMKEYNQGKLEAYKEYMGTVIELKEEKREEYYEAYSQEEKKDRNKIKKEAIKDYKKNKDKAKKAYKKTYSNLKDDYKDALKDCKKL